jgi:hypothetical protein
MSNSNALIWVSPTFFKYGHIQDFSQRFWAVEIPESDSIALDSFLQIEREVGDSDRI